jgi:hypothetical protein
MHAWALHGCAVIYSEPCQLAIQQLWRMCGAYAACASAGFLGCMQGKVNLSDAGRDTGKAAHAGMQWP